MDDFTYIYLVTKLILTEVTRSSAYWLTFINIFTEQKNIKDRSKDLRFLFLQAIIWLLS